MTMALSRLTMVVPGLLGPVPGTELQDFPWPRVPSLERLLNLARCEQEPTQSLEAWLCAHFGVTPTAPADWPLAPLLASHELGAAEPGYWLCADPVHLRADRSRLLLFGPEELAIQRQEAIALAATVNELYGPDGWRLVVAAPERWYLHLPKAAQIHTTMLSAVLARDIDGSLPEGPDAAHWHGLMNEIQMLFHTHEVNEKRADEGRPMINSLWFWGGGNAAQLPTSDHAGVIADSLLAKALAVASGVSVSDVTGSQDAAATLSGRDILVVWEDCARALQQGRLNDWCAAHELLERRWWQPLLAQVRAGTLQTLEIQTLSGSCFQLQNSHWWSGWRHKPLRRFLVPHPSR